MKKLVIVFCMLFVSMSVFAIDFWLYDADKNEMTIYQVDPVFKKFNVLTISGTSIYNIELSVSNVTRNGNVYTVTLENGVIHKFSLSQMPGMYGYSSSRANGESIRKEQPVFELRSSAMPGLTQAIFSYLFSNSSPLQN